MAGCSQLAKMGIAQSSSSYLYLSAIKVYTISNVTNSHLEWKVQYVMVFLSLFIMYREFCNRKFTILMKVTNICNFLYFCHYTKFKLGGGGGCFKDGCWKNWAPWFVFHPSASVITANLDILQGQLLFALIHLDLSLLIGTCNFSKELFQDRAVIYSNGPFIYS